MDIRRKLELDALLKRLSDVTQLLPALTADNAASERRRLARCLVRGESAEPRWRWTRRSAQQEPRRWLDTARVLAADAPAPGLYARRLDEVELDLDMLAVLGDCERIPRLAARRFGTGAMRVDTADGDVSLDRVAGALLATVHDSPERRVLPADDARPGAPSVGRFIRSVAQLAGLEVRVAVEPRLAAAAAAGQRTVLLADRRFGWNEGRRLAVHEVLGHLVSAANGRAQPLRVVEVGTAGSFGDQEGLCLLLEEQAGLLDGRRLRTLAARVVAAGHMHEGRGFGDSARVLIDEHGLSAEDAVNIAERAYRGGGVARDVSYLAGWLRVRRAVERGEATVDELRAGRVSLAELPVLRQLIAEGWARPSVYQPSLSRSLVATQAGTSLEISPPRDAASFTRFEAT